jgi:hypothetical protein
MRLTIYKEWKNEQLKRDEEIREKEEAALAGKKIRKKRPPLKRKRSFAECGMKFEDGLGLRQAYLESRTGPNLITAFTEEQMRLCGIFPINVPLLSKPDNYDLHIDSIMM